MTFVAESRPAPGRRLVLGALTLAALAVPGLAAGQVSLETEVSKVETTLDDDGRTRRALLATDTVVPGEELRYTITFRNDSEVVVGPGRIVITNPLPEGTRYVAGSAGGESARIEYASDGRQFTAGEPAGEVRSIRWTYEDDLAPGEESEVFFHVRMQ